MIYRLISELINGLIRLTIEIAMMLLRFFITHIIPAIFDITVSLTAMILELLPEAASRFSAGAVVAVSAIAWTIIGTGLGLALVGFEWWQTTITLWMAGISLTWGLAVGGVVARQRSQTVRTLVSPDAVEKSGLHPDMVVDDQQDAEIDIEDLFTQGIFMGRSSNRSSRR